MNFLQSSIQEQTNPVEHCGTSLVVQIRIDGGEWLRQIYSVGLFGEQGGAHPGSHRHLLLGQVLPSLSMQYTVTSREIPASEKTALEAVMEADEERIKLEALAEMLALETDDASQEYLMQVYERLDDLGANTAESRAAHLLMGLQFTPAMQNKKCKDFSGGWRMRVALARALFLKPHLLLLDEPTNHLDLEACVWLEEELKTYPTILLIVSHSQDFLNGVCTSIMVSIFKISQTIFVSALMLSSTWTCAS